MSRRVLILVGALLLAALALFSGRLAPALAAAQAERYDLLIRNGRVMDGSGNPWIRGDVAIRGGRVAAVGHLPGADAARVIDARGRHVAPGFIDVHSHAAEGLVDVPSGSAEGFSRTELRQAQPLLAQGVTTIVANPDGGGPADLAAQHARFERDGVGVNVALLVGHASVRRAILGMADRAPTADELERMRELTRQGMREGAFGLSSGLFYAPGSYATTDEVIALARVAAEFGGVYTSHIRDEGNYSVGVVAAVSEVIQIAEEAGLTGIVSHMKALGPDNWGLATPSIMRIDAARARGIAVFADQYPYDASSTGLAGALIPRWAQAGGDEQLVARINAPDTRARLMDEVRVNLRRRGGAASLVIAHFAPDHRLEGLTLDEIARARRQPPEDAALDLVTQGGASVVSFNMSEQDIEHIMRQTYTMTSSDGGLVPMGRGKPHPRNYGAFARKLSRYARERGTIDLPFAIRSMTSLPAAVFAMSDRGVLRPGVWADIAIFDPSRVRDAATYADPHQLAQGMDYVLVNGAVAVDEGRFTGALAGRVIRRGE